MQAKAVPHSEVQRDCPPRPRRWRVAKIIRARQPLTPPYLRHAVRHDRGQSRRGHDRQLQGELLSPTQTNAQRAGLAQLAANNARQPY